MRREAPFTITSTALVAALALASCASPGKTFGKHEQSRDLCVGNRPAQTVTAYFSLYTRPSPGTPVDSVGAQQDQTRAFFDDLSGRFFQILANHSLRSNGRSLSCHNMRGIGIFPPGTAGDPVSEGAPPWPPGGVRLVRTSTERNSFVVCGDSECAGLADPVSHETVKCDEGCRAGGVPPSDLHLSSDFFVETPCFLFGTTTTSPHLLRNDRTDFVWGFIYDSGINLGRFMKEHYFTVPESERDQLCERAGQKSGCLAGPFKSANDSRRYWGPKPSPTLQESALPLIFALSVNATTKVDGPWIVRSVTLDPTLLCKYAHPGSDLVTH